MYISRNLLCSIVPEFKDVSDFDIDRSTYNLGMVLEQVIKHPELKDVCVGKVIKVDKIKKSNKLHYASIDVGNQKILKIVCGASNFKKGDKVVVALPGAKLYDGRIVEEKELLGHISQGMLCGYNELTPYCHDTLDNNDKNGIIILDKDAEIGSFAVNKELGLDDTLYELTLPSDRPEWMGAILIIKDLANWFGFKFNVRQVINKLQTFANDFVKIDTKLSTFGSYIKIDGVNFKKYSPWKLKKYLINNACKCENKVNDIITYITYLTGVAPIVFDADKTPTDICEKYATIGQQLSFKNKIYNLKSEDVILTTSNNEVLGLEGICVDDKYAPNLETKSIGLYISDLTHWLPRKSAIVHNITTPSARFAVRHVSLFQINLFINYISKQFRKSIITKLCNEIEPTKEIPFDLKECVEFISPITDKQFKTALKILGFKLLKSSAIVPGYRKDLVNQYDLCEEVIKKLSIDAIEIQPIKLDINVTQPPKDEFYFLTGLRKIMIENYLTETKTYNLVSKESIERWNVFNLKPMYEINPCSNNEHRFMRLSLIDNMIKVMEYNMNRKNSLLPIFELQKIYNQTNEWNLTCISPEKYCFDELHRSNLNFDTFGLKALIKQIASFFNASLVFSKITNKCFAQKDCLSIEYNGQIIGFVGCLNSNMLKPYKITQKLYALVLNINSLIENYSEKEFKITQLLTALPIIKDVTFLANENTDIANINKELSSLDCVEKYQYTTVYHPENSQDVSYTIRLTINNNKTMNKEEIDSVISIIVNIIKNNKGDVKGF